MGPRAIGLVERKPQGGAKRMVKTRHYPRIGTVDAADGKSAMWSHGGSTGGSRDVSFADTSAGAASRSGLSIWWPCATSSTSYCYRAARGQDGIAMKRVRATLSTVSPTIHLGIHYSCASALDTPAGTWQACTGAV